MKYNAVSAAFLLDESEQIYRSAAMGGQAEAFSILVGCYGFSVFFALIGWFSYWVASHIATRRAMGLVVLCLTIYFFRWVFSYTAGKPSFGEIVFFGLLSLLPLHVSAILWLRKYAGPSEPPPQT